MTKADRNASPSNSTFASRAAERAGKPVEPRRPRGLRAGDNAETDVVIITSNRRENSVQQIRA